MIFVKRAYEPFEESDGTRFLVDRLWPRGVRKEVLRAEWLKDVSPTEDLREWFGHDPEKWEQFQRRYAAELNRKPRAWHKLLEMARDRDITLVYAADDTEHNNAVALRSYIIGRIKATARSKRPKVHARMKVHTAAA
jgi:uncharacterized protein YeaO (DUF488 family)